MREIKFRMWNGTSMFYDVGNVYECLKQQKAFDEKYTMNQQLGVIPYDHIGLDNCVFLQYTGLKDKNVVEIYEGDVKREEIEQDDGDITYYFVCTYIYEWSMFAWLSITNGEYQKYLDKGAESLDTEMYWTYPLQHDEIDRTTICGNIYQHPHLLEK